MSISLLGEGEWTPLMQHYRFVLANLFKLKLSSWSDFNFYLCSYFSGYSAKDLSFVVPLLSKALYTAEFSKNGQKMNAIKKKFSEPKVYREILNLGKGFIKKKVVAAKSPKMIGKNSLDTIF